MALDTENVTDEQLGRLEELAVAAEASGPPVHAIVSTDGDSDRPLVAAVLPSRAAGSPGRRVRFLPGDLLGIIVAQYLSADAVAVPISANDAVERRMGERGIWLEKTKIGSPYVVASIDALRNSKRYSRIVGWEANGGFLTGSDIALTRGTIAALPSRDATLPILATLFAAAERGVSLDSLWSELPARFGRSGLIDHVPSATSRATLARLTPPGPSTEVLFDDEGNEPERGWQETRAILGRVFTPALGFGKIVRINVLAGLRVYFENGDVAHVRPSGNAPQLRIYSNSDSQARADQIVEDGLREPDGLLRELTRVVGV
jgi:phosphomannomutase